MGNFIFAYDMVSGTGTASSESSPYVATNLSILEHTRRHWRAGSFATDQWAQVAFSSSTIRAIQLNDVNFTSCTVTASGSPIAMTPALDERTGRVKLTAVLDDPCTAIKVDIPVQGLTDNLSVPRIGSIIAATSRLEVTINPSHPYSYSADEASATNDFRSGGFTDRNLGPRIWKGSFGFQYHPRTSESEIWTFNSTLKSGNLIFFENLGDVSKGYFCRRRSSIEVSWVGYDYNQITSISLQELY